MEAMTALTGPRITNAEKLENSILITFDDGRCALYSALLLHDKISEAREIKESELDLE